MKQRLMLSILTFGLLVVFLGLWGTVSAQTAAPRAAIAITFTVLPPSITPTPRPTLAPSATPSPAASPTMPSSPTPDAAAKAQAYIERGNAFLEVGQYQDALEAYDQALALSPDDLNALVGRGTAYANLGDDANAVVDLSRFIAAVPDFSTAYVIRGVSYNNLGFYAEAAADFTQGIDIDQQNNAFVYGNRAISFYLLGDPARAIEDATRAIELDNTYLDAYFIRAVAYRDQQAYQESIDDYTHLIEVSSTFADAYYYRSRLYGILGEYDLMLADLRTYQELAQDGGDPRIAALLDRLDSPPAEATADNG